MIVRRSRGEYIVEQRIVKLRPHNSLCKNTILVNSVVFNKSI